jgi:hypothetical protein
MHRRVVAVSLTTILVLGGTMASSAQDASLEALCEAIAIDEGARSSCLDAVAAILTDDRDALDTAVGALEDAIRAIEDLAGEVDLELGIDPAAVEGAVDEALGLAEDSGLSAGVQQVADVTSEVVASAEAWIGENPEATCQAVSMTVGLGAGAVAGLLSGSPGLALRAFEEAERAATGLCGQG